MIRLPFLLGRECVLLQCALRAELIAARRARLQGAAGRFALIIGGVVADDGIDDVDALLVGVRLPVVHPFALGPRIRAKEDDLLVAEGLLDLIPHGLELIIFKLLGTHGGAAEGDSVIASGLVCGEVGAGDDLCLGAGIGAPSATRFAMASVLPVPLQ